MKPIRFALSLVGSVLLVMGYFASQIAYFQGDPSGYAAKVDQPPVRLLASLFFICALAFAIVPDREGDSS